MYALLIAQNEDDVAIYATVLQRAGLAVKAFIVVTSAQEVPGAGFSVL